MKLSAKSRYAIRAMIYLAMHNRDGQHISLKEISEKEDISIKYLEQIFTVLRKENMVKSIKGSYGGYSLACDRNKITIGGIVRAVEGEIYSISSEEKKDYPNNSIEYFMIENFWEELDKSVNTYLDKKNLEEIVKEFEKVNGKPEETMYAYRNSYF